MTPVIYESPQEGYPFAVFWLDEEHTFDWELFDSRGDAESFVSGFRYVALEDRVKSADETMERKWDYVTIENNGNYHPVRWVDDEKGISANLFRTSRGEWSDEISYHSIPGRESWDVAAAMLATLVEVEEASDCGYFELDEILPEANYI